MTKIKICGMQRIEDIQYVNKYRPDYAGFILSEGFGRTVVLNTFCKLDSYLDKDIKRVGVFVNEPIENILKYYAEKLNVIQLHGNEDREYIERLKSLCRCEIWKAVRAKTPEDIINAEKLGADRLLIDSYVKGKVGGTGTKADFNIIKTAAPQDKFMLAGGLDKNNILSAIDELHPYGVDLSSSVETNGFKDKEKIREIISIVRGGNDNG